MKQLRWLLLFLLLALTTGIGWVYHSYQTFLRQPLHVNTAEQQTVRVPRGSSYAEMVQQLVDSGISDNIWPWRLLQRLHPRTIQAGEYRLDAGMTPEQWLERLTRGDVIQYRFTIIEGWRYRDLRRQLEAEEDLVDELVTMDDTEVQQRLGIDNASLEGWFLPETYSYVRGDSDFDILRQAYRMMRATLDESWRSRAPDLPLKNPYEMLVLASIVEKETALASERAEIAGVFTRRLNKKMRLQTDPTVIYGLGENFDGDIRSRDLRTDTPYNTYTRFGLPPTPIALPGADSIRAVAHPADGDSLYFVADGSGGHTFSKTYAEHKRAVQKMLRRK